MSHSSPEPDNLLPLDPVPTEADHETVLEPAWVATNERGYEVLDHDNGWTIASSKTVDIGGGFGVILDQVGLTDGAYRDEWNKQLVCHDDEQRERMRKPFERLLRPQQVAKLQGTVRELINGILDDIKDPTNVEFMPEFADRLPTQLFCRLISAPLDQEPDIFRITSQINPSL